jgi:hypothetical protein
LTGRRGRPAGSRSPHTRALIRAIAATGTDDLVLALSRVIEDTAQPVDVRCEAARHLAGASIARIVAAASPPAPVTDWLL